MVRDLPFSRLEGLGRIASGGSFVMIMAIIVLCCAAENMASFVSDAAALLGRMETDAAILALSIFMFIVLRVWSAARTASIRAEAQ